MKKTNVDCFTGDCPVIKVDERVVKLSEGSGGKEMNKLIDSFTKNFIKTEWNNTNNDSATIKIGNETLVFTTDSYVVTPIFFPGGNIGKVAFCGTVNDLLVMGAKPLGISLSLVIEEGFSKIELEKIIQTIADLSKKTNIPIVTGDTKVMEKGGIDKIIINTSGVGITKNIFDKKLCIGDKIIVSGGIGEHSTALLAKRYDIETEIITDCKPLIKEINSIREYIKQSKDITRGGLSAILNEVSKRNNVQLLIDEEKVPMKKEVRALTNILGIDVYNLACEGTFLCVVSDNDSKKVIEELKKFNSHAAIIGEVKEGKEVIIQTKFGRKLLSEPSGNIVPRIC